MSKTWKAIHPPLIKVDWVNLVWFKSRIPKHSFIIWLVMRDRLSTRDSLRSWGLSISSDFLLCDSASESKSRIFFNCSYSAEVWNSFFTHQALSPPVLFNDIVRWVHHASRIQKLKTICKLIFQAVVYFLWKERNSRLHSSTSKPTQLLVKEIQILLRAKLISLDRVTASTNQIISSAPVSLSDSLTYISTWFGFIQS